MIPSAKPASNVKENHTDLFKRSVLFVVKRSLFVAVLLLNDYDRHALFQCCQVVDGYKTLCMYRLSKARESHVVLGRTTNPHS